MIAQPDPAIAKESPLEAPTLAVTPAPGRPTGQHDVRTSLHAIRGNVELMLCDEADNLSAEGRSCLGEIVEAVRELEAALERADLLTASG